MEALRHTFPFDFVITLGDNIYGGRGANDFLTKFELPYKALLDAGVKFYASLGNHDGTEESLYKPFNMAGQRYYTYKKGKTQFFALDSSYLSLEQLSWLEEQLRSSTADWKIPYFHHPLYSSAIKHGSELELRKVLEPLFLEYGVQIEIAGNTLSFQTVSRTGRIVDSGRVTQAGPPD